MKVLTPGHKYELDHFENGSTEGYPCCERLQFIHKRPIHVGSSELELVADGTTNEEVLRVLIDRMNYLQGLFPCRENAIVITKLEESLMWLNKRTEDRKARNVEGKHVA